MTYQPVVFVIFFQLYVRLYYLRRLSGGRNRGRQITEKRTWNACRAMRNFR
jgi:hypothetical protein